MKGGLSKTQKERLRKVEGVDVGATGERRVLRSWRPFCCGPGSGRRGRGVLLVERLGKNVTRIALGDEVKKTGGTGRNDERPTGLWASSPHGGERCKVQGAGAGAGEEDDG